MSNLRELAIAATMAPCDHGCYDGHDGQNRNCYERRQAFQALVKAVASPSVIIALLDERDAAIKRELIARDRLVAAKEATQKLVGGHCHACDGFDGSRKDRTCQGIAVESTADDLRNP